ncbi:MAG: hypothetical protein ACF8OB_05965 [Phycisphaeraceae bacterium JB051]
MSSFKQLPGTLFLIGCLMTSSALAQQQQPQIPWGENLVKNGSFEQGNGAYYITRHDRTRIDLDVVYRGLHALRLEGGNNEPKKDHTIVVQGFKLSLQAGAQVLYRMAYRCENADEKYPASLGLVYKVEGEKKDHHIKLDKPLLVKKDCDWTVYEVVLKDLPADATLLGFNVKVPRESAATLWIDDIQVRTYTPSK